eukprot:sb/3472502/
MENIHPHGYFRQLINSLIVIVLVFSSNSPDFISSSHHWELHTLSNASSPPPSGTILILHHLEQFFSSTIWNNSSPLPSGAILHPFFSVTLTQPPFLWNISPLSRTHPPLIYLILSSLGTLSHPLFAGDVVSSSLHWELFHILSSLGTISPPLFTGNFISFSLRDT